MDSLNGHSFKIVSLAFILKSKIAAKEPLLLCIPYIHHSCEFPLWAGIHVIIY